jgi:DNA-binding NarL/FixJ family response regulator
VAIVTSVQHGTKAPPLEQSGEHSRDRTPAPVNASISICCRNPIAVWAVGELLTKGSYRWGVVKCVTGSLPATSPGLQIVLVDAPSIPEWPELVAQWAPVGFKTILLMAERWDFVDAELRALRLGVSGIVRIAGEFAGQLRDAITMVAAGHLYVKDEASQTGRRAFELEYSRLSDPDLSFREKQVLDLVMLGFTNRRIGTLLGITERTAKFHVCNILHKMNAKRRKDVVGIRAKHLLAPPKIAPVVGHQAGSLSARPMIE